MKIIAAGKIIFTTVPHALISCLRLDFVRESHVVTHSKGQIPDKDISKNLPAIQSLSRLYADNPSSGVSSAFLVHMNYFGKYEYTTMTGSIVYLSGSAPNRVSTVKYTYTLTNRGKTISILRNFTAYRLQSGISNIEHQSTGSNETECLNFTIYSVRNSPASNMSTLEIAGTDDVVVSVASYGASLVIGRGIVNGK